jgi:hypothetical protein
LSDFAKMEKCQSSDAWVEWMLRTVEKGYCLLECHYRVSQQIMVFTHTILSSQFELKFAKIKRSWNFNGGVEVASRMIGWYQSAGNGLLQNTP